MTILMESMSACCLADMTEAWLTNVAQKRAARSRHLHVYCSIQDTSAGGATQVGGDKYTEEVEKCWELEFTVGVKCCYSNILMVYKRPRERHDHV